jgi:segregation and condensation protein A
MTTFTARVPSFEGPLDLLLQLIEKRKLHISTISLSSITEDYLAHLKKSETETSNTSLADFLVIAATLILIKSVALLPALETTTEEKSDISDLQLRLNLLALFQELGRNLKIRYGQKRLFFAKERKITHRVFAPSMDLTLANLTTGINSVIMNLPKIEVLPEVKVRKVISLETVIQSLSDRIGKAARVRFSEFAKQTGEGRVGLIVSFLGMLELVKQGIIEATQNNDFGEIDLSNNSLSTPHYF